MDGDSLQVAPQPPWGHRPIPEVAVPGVSGWGGHRLFPGIVNEPPNHRL